MPSISPRLPKEKGSVYFFTPFTIMEKIKGSIQKELPPLKIYKDELYELYECLKSNCGAITIQACGYRLSSLDEIDKLPEKETNYIQFDCSDPYLRIKLSNWSGELYIGEKDIETEGLSAHLTEILLRGKTGLWGSLYRSPGCVYGFYGVVSGILIAAGLFGKSTILWIITGVFIMFSGTLLDKIPAPWYNIIVFSYRKDTRNFFQRNRDKIFLLILGSFITVLVQSLYHYFLK